MGKAAGGTNGSLPILIGPLQMDYDRVISAFLDTEKPLLLPVVYIDTENSRHIDSNSLAKELYGKAAVVARSYEKLEKGGDFNKKTSFRTSGKMNPLFLLFKRLKQLPMKAEVFYPDGERVDVEASRKKAMENEIVKVIMNSQSKQFTPIDYRYISGKKKYCNAMNYKAPNFYCRALFEIMAGLTEKERNKIKNSIIYFPIDQKMIKRIDAVELRKILGIIQISGKKDIGVVNV